MATKRTKQSTFSEREFRDALDRIMLSSLAPLTVGGAVLFALLAALKPLLYGPMPEPTLLLLSGCEALLSLLFVAIYVGVRRGWIRARWAHPAAAAFLLPIAANAALEMAVLGRPLQTIAFILQALGCGAFLLSARWLVLAFAGQAVFWTLGALLTPASAFVAPVLLRPELGHYLFQAMLLGTIVFVFRRRMIRNLELLRVRDERSRRALQASNRELESFSYSVSHDLRAPLRGIHGFTDAVLQDYGGALPEDGRASLQRVRRSAERMEQLIDDLLEFSRATRLELRREPVDLSALARGVVSELERAEPARRMDVAIADGLEAEGDPALLRVVLVNLLGNAWKYTSREPRARIEFGALPAREGAAFFVRDNGAGFDMAYADKLFQPFSRLHREDEFPGAGVGLATVRRIVERHGGEAWGEGAPGAGATFYFTVGRE